MKVKKNTVKIITLGCSKNLVDSEHLFAMIASNDLKIVRENEKADNVIINTCGFIESAKEESINTILSAVKEKEKGNLKNLFVAGCLSERYMKDLEKEIPEVDKYFGATDKKKTIRDILKSLEIDYKKSLVGERVISTPSHFAYLKISEGCDNPCSFCAIPIMRGGHKSKPLKDILHEAELLSEKGVKELIIIGQDTTYWGFDNTGKRNLAKVLDELSKIKGIEWIRLMYAYPSRFPSDIIEVIREKDNITKYLDIPIQHISDKVLKSMRRGITKKVLTDLLEKIRKEIPGIALRTTLITGYPNETEKEFLEMLKFLKEFKFERLGVFTYSNEDDTTAAKELKDIIPQKEKFARQQILLEAQRKISLEKNTALTGKKMKVLIDRKDGNYYAGRTYMDAPEVDQEVIIDTKKKLETGNFYETLIYDCEDFDLFGEV
jgi:ribosomal protein S12 methylthiotransferase